MIRTAVSIGILFGSLLLVSRAMQTGCAYERGEEEEAGGISLVPPENAVRSSRTATSRDTLPPRVAGARLRRGTPTPVPQLDDEDLPAPDWDTVLAPSLEQRERQGEIPIAVREEVDAGDQPSETEQPETEQPETEPSVGEPVESLAPILHLTEEMRARRARIQTCLAYYYQLPENAAERSPWGLMHTAVAYGVDTHVNVNDRQLNAIGYLCYNGSCRGQRLFRLVDGGLHVETGPGYQGHEGQFLSILAQSRISSEYPLRIEGEKFKVLDLINYERQTCQGGTELTFKLIGLSHYLASDARWRNAYGTWSIARLIQEELAQPVLGAACGGTHRLMGFSYAVRQRELRDEPIDGQWLRARKYVNAYVDYTLQLQNADGSFSSEWFEGRGNSDDIERRLLTTGHVLEWLVFTLSHEKMHDPRVVRAIDHLTTLLLDYRTHAWEIGPRGHALHALALYDEKTFGRKPGERDFQIVEEVLPPAATPPLVSAESEADEYEDGDRGRPLRRRRLLRR